MRSETLAPRAPEAEAEARTFEICADHNNPYMADTAEDLPF